MLVRNATYEDICRALDKTNVDFDGNIKFKRCDYSGQTKQDRAKFTATLTVFDSSGPGGRRNREGRKIAAACWHVHGRFMDHLPDHVEVVVTTMPCRYIFRPGDTWQDWNITTAPNWPMSLCCECHQWNIGGVIVYPILKEEI